MPVIDLTSIRIDLYLIIQIIVSLWSSIASSAAVYTFSLFAPSLKLPPHNLSESQISIISGFFIFSTFLNQGAGVILDNFGPRWTIFTGCVIMTVSWMLLSYYVFADNTQLQIDLALERMMSMNMTSTTNNNDTMRSSTSSSSTSSTSPHFVFVTILFMLPTFAGSFNEAGGVLGQLRQFELQSSAVIILQKVFIGLGATIVGSIFAAYFAPDLTTIVKVPNPFLNNNTNSSSSHQELLLVELSIETLQPYSTFCNILAVYSCITMGVFSFMIGYRNKEPAPGLTTPPTIFTQLYKKLMLRGEYCLYVGIVLLLGGNLLIVWTGNHHHEENNTSDDDNNNSSNSVSGLRQIVAIIAIILPFSFFSMLQLLPSQDQLDEMHRKASNKNDEKHNSNNKDKNFTVEENGEVLVRKNAAAASRNNRDDDDKYDSDQEMKTKEDAEKESFDVKLDEILKKCKSKNENKVNEHDDILDVFDVSPPRNSKDIFHNMKKPELLMMWYVAFCVWGTCTMIYSNSSTIYRALPGRRDEDDEFNGDGETNDHQEGTSSSSPQQLLLPFSPSLNAIFVSLISAGNALSRSLVGKLIPVLRSRREAASGSGKVLHPMLMVPPILASLSCALLLVSEGVSLWLPFVMAGCAVGFFWASLILIVKESFVASGTTYAFLYTSGALTPFVFIMLLFRTNYHYYQEAQTEKQKNDVVDYEDSSSKTCYGRECIAFPMVVCIFLNISAFITAVILCKRIDKGCFDDESDDMMKISDENKEVEEIVIRDGADEN